jgi:SAM-dependent methyltransferase
LPGYEYGPPSVGSYKSGRWFDGLPRLLRWWLHAGALWSRILQLMKSTPDASDRDGLRAEPWAAHARQWSRLGPPLRPALEDLQRLQTAWLNSLAPVGLPARRVEILSLGVTPEIASFGWAEDYFLTAADASEVMIRAVWPGDAPNRQAVQASWQELPFADGTFDLIVSDGGLVPLAAPGQLAALGLELRRALRPTGRVVMRHFIRPVLAESPADLVRALEAGNIRGFHELKLRLVMALGEAPAGVRLADVWECFQQWFPDREALAARLGCPLEVIATIDAYRDREARYVFPDLTELSQTFARFSLAVGPAGHYPFAPCCPVFCLTPKP